MGGCSPDAISPPEEARCNPRESVISFGIRFDRFDISTPLLLAHVDSGQRPQCYCLCRRRMTRITDSCVGDGDDRADRTRAGSCCPSKQRGWVRFVFVRYCWPALTARKFYGRRQKTIDCLNFEWSARVSIVFASGRARANEVAFVVISNLREVPGEQSLNKNQVVGGV